MIPGERDAGGSEISKVEKPSGLFTNSDFQNLLLPAQEEKKRKEKKKGQNKKQTNTRPNTRPLLLMLAGGPLPYGGTSIGPDWTRTRLDSL